MRKAHFPWIIAIILVVAVAGWHLIGLILAAAGLFISYLASLRLHPRIRHGRCGGTGEHRGAIFTWTHRKCGGCNGGRLIRWGAGQWGAGHIQAEYRRTEAARAAARSNSTWR
jgi:hypothetical protein